MNKTVLASLLILLNGTSPQTRAEPPSPPKTTKLTLDIPKATWVPVFFGKPGQHQTINGRGALSGLTNLQAVPLPAGDLEVRVWEGFGLTDLQGYVLRRTRGTWEAIQLLPASPKYKSRHYLRALPPPKSGWVILWSSLEKEGLLTLPDSSTLKDEKHVLDGTSYVVEISRDKTYRTYGYGNPDYQSWPEAKQMLKIAEILRQEFPTNK